MLNVINGVHLTYKEDFWVWDVGGFGRIQGRRGPKDY